ncbi:DinB family protein [Sphingobacterium sp. MYb382]|uniref:DinB family protein n=1 Tax=Sphingobacterium sp. MYb382 TaxID=2745278 RepID=UPI00309585BC
MSSYLKSALKELKHSKVLVEKTIDAIDEDMLNWSPAEGTNSISIIVRHVTENIRSRFTDFLTSDGEKSWRNRDAEFEEADLSKADLLAAWEKSWAILLENLEPLTEADLERTIYIRGEGHTVTQAINRQVAHYASHMGQIVFIGKIIKGKDWESLSIPRGQSKAFNQQMFDTHKGDAKA